MHDKNLSCMWVTGKKDFHFYRKNPRVLHMRSGRNWRRMDEGVSGRYQITLRTEMNWKLKDKNISAHN